MEQPHCITARNVNDAFMNGIWYLRCSGVREDTRNGPCLVAPGPVITTYLNPAERILWEPRRDANPVFHLMEAIWMLAGRKHVGFLLPFNSRFSEYAEDDGCVHGAYGYRWREHWSRDQVVQTINTLKNDPNSRRAVIAMWDPDMDIMGGKRDIPCNTHIYFDLRGGKLNMTVCCRSNDALWGAYGANAVHFSILQEIISHGVGAPVGVYRQMSNNFHVYTEVPMVRDFLDTPPVARDMYATNSHLRPTPLLQKDELVSSFIADCVNLVLDLKYRYETKFFQEVAVPLHDLYLHRKAGGLKPDYVRVPGDWGLAFDQWVARRSDK